MTESQIKNDEHENQLRREAAARKAKVEGFIKLIDLESILAVDSNFPPETLSKLDSIFQPGSPPLLKNFKSKEYRHGFWLLLLLRWTGLRATALKEQLPDTGKCLPSYQFNRETGKYVLIDLRSVTAEYFDKAYISIGELYDFFYNLEYAYQIDLPLPNLLRRFETPISARKVMQKLGVDVYQFVHALRNGLKPYEPEGESFQRQLDIYELCNSANAMPKDLNLNYATSDESKLIDSLRFMPSAVEFFLNINKIPKKIVPENPEIDKKKTIREIPDNSELRKRFRSEGAFKKALERADQLLLIRSNNPNLDRSNLKKDYKLFFPGGSALSTFIRDMQHIQKHGADKYKNLLPRDRPGSKKKKKAKII